MIVLLIAYAVLAALVLWAGGPAALLGLAILTGLMALGLLLLAHVVEAGVERRQRQIGVRRARPWFEFRRR